MKKIFIKHYKNILILIISIIFLAIGTTFYINSNFGSDSFFSLIQGVSRILKIKIGWANILCNIVLLIIMIFVNRKGIGIGTIFMVFLAGIVLNVFVRLNILPPATNIYWKIIYIFVGNIICAFGIALFIYANRGISPLEGFLLVIQEKSKWPLWVLKIVLDAILYGVGFLLGATISFGSIISLLIYGPLLDIFLKLIRKTNIIKEV